MDKPPLAVHSWDVIESKFEKKFLQIFNQGARFWGSASTQFSTRDKKSACLKINNR